METDLLAGLEKPCCVMTVLPHPDDESFAAGGVLALYARDPQVRTVVLCMSRGGLSGAMDIVGLPSEREEVIREREFNTATTILGVDETLLWDYGDQDMCNFEQELEQRIEAAIREKGADVVITYGPEGITGHIDHLTCSAATRRAAEKAGVKRLYMVTAPQWIGWVFLRKKLLPITHGIDISPVYPVKMLALRSHASQMLITREPMIWVGVIMRIAGKEYYHRVF